MKEEGFDKAECQSTTKRSKNWDVKKGVLVSDKEPTLTGKSDDPQPPSGSEKLKAGPKPWNAQKGLFE